VKDVINVVATIKQMPKAKTVEKLMAKPLQPSSTHTE
jgi:hypothetical protein